MAALAPIQILFRSKDAVELFTLPDTSLSSASASVAVSANKAGGGGGGGVTLYRGKTSFHILNPNGRYAYLHDVDVGLIKCDLSACSNNEDAAIAPFIPDSKSVQLAKCSPCGTYILTWTKPNSNSSNKNDCSNSNNNSSVENLRIYDAITGKFLHGFSCKKATLSTLQWTHDESLLFHLVSNEVHVYSAQAFQRVGKIRCPNIESFSLPTVKISSANTTQLSNNEHEKKYLLITFAMGSKGKPSRVDLLRYPDRMGVESSTKIISGTSTTKMEKEEEESAAVVNQSSGLGLAYKSLFDAEEVAVHWSPRADSALVLSQTAVDATGESYYGSSHLFLFLENDVKRPGCGVAISVTLPTEATKSVHGSIPILCANWVPNPKTVGPVPFGVISGSMPPLASLHHGITAEPTFLFGRAHRNTMDISPHGRFLVCGGYGNLAGGMDFWDRNKGKPIPRRVVLPSLSSSSSVSTNKAFTPEARRFVTIKEASELSITSKNPAVGHQWSPDSRTYLVSTTSPRMNVDNGVHIYRYDGSLVDETRLPWDNATYRPDKLLCAEYVPAPFPLNEAVEVEKERETTKNFYYYPDRPQSPSPRGWVEVSGDEAKLALATLASQNSMTSNFKGGTSGGGSGASSYVPPGERNADAYAPPGARKGVTGRVGGTLAERMRQDRQDMTSKVSCVKITKRTGPVGASSVTSAATVSGVGAAALAGEKSKSALRREKQNLLREKAEREAAEAEQRKKDEERARTEANKADPEKRAKKIKKLLKQIDEIKAKVSSGCEMNDDQRKKIETEDELVKELASLGL